MRHVQREYLNERLESETATESPSDPPSRVETPGPAPHVEAFGPDADGPTRPDPSRTPTARRPATMLPMGVRRIVLLAGLTWLLEARPGIAWFRPIEVFGANALLVYILSNLLTVILSAVATGPSR